MEALTLTDVRPHANIPEALSLVNGRYVVADRVLRAIRESSMPEGLQVVACLEAHYRRRLLESRSLDDRLPLYEKAYSELSDLCTALGQTNHGLVENFVAYFEPHLRGRSVLELGCGCGLLLPRLRGAVARYLGLDASRTAIETACSENASLLSDRFGFELRNIATGALPGRDAGFDVIYCNDFLEHLHRDDLNRVLAACARTLLPGGKLLLVLPNRFFGPYDISRRFLPLGAPCEALHLSEMSYAETAACLRAAGFQGIRTSALGLGAVLKLRRLFGTSLTVPVGLKGVLETIPFGRAVLGPAFGLRAVVLLAETPKNGA